MATNRDDISRDELRRQLRESQRDHDEAMPKLRSILDRVFSPGSAASAGEKEALLGIPSRRALIGGGTILAGAALAAACTEPKKKEQLSQTGGSIPDPNTSTTLEPQTAADEAQRLDLNLLRTSQSVEALAIAAYSLTLATGKLSGDVAEMVRLFQDQHRDHQGAIVTQIQSVGGDPYTNPNPGDAPSGVSANEWAQVNPWLWKETVEPVVKDAGSLDQAAIVKFATSLEDVAANSYTKFGGLLGSPDSRQFIMSIGGIEARHVSVLLGISQTDPRDPRLQVPYAFEKTANAVPPDAYVGSGEVRRRAQTTTITAKPPATTALRSTGTTTKGSTGTTVGG